MTASAQGAILHSTYPRPTRRRSSTKRKPEVTDLFTDRFLRLEQVLEIAGLSKAMVYRLVREGKFPKPLKPGGAATRWRESEVREWHAGVIAARDRTDEKAAHR